MTTPRVRLSGDTIQIGRLSITFQRTLRIPDDGRSYPLPPGLGEFPVRRVKDFADRVPAAWRKSGGYFIPMYQREALWISFHGDNGRPNALKIGVGGVNAISGAPFDKRLRRNPQDYLVVPDQPWLDGINSGPNTIRQFVAMPLGQGFTVEGQVTGEEKEGGIQLTVVEPKAGRFPSRPRFRGLEEYSMVMVCDPSMASLEMGLGAGGQMEQKIYPDHHGPGTWDLKQKTTVRVHIVNSEMYQAITGERAPATPISARTYTEYGFPWFKLYDEHRKDVDAPKILKKVKSIATLEAEARVKGIRIVEELVVKNIKPLFELTHDG